MFFHSGGAIGSLGSVDSIQVDISESRLSGYNFPDPPTGDDQIQAIVSVLSLLTITDDQIIIPLVTSVFRSVMGEILPVDFTLFLVGPTGCQKSEITGIMQSFFGSTFNGKNLPGNWSATANSLERMAFLAKDCIFTVDDFAPSGSQYDVARLHREADRLFRGQGNRSGRARMRSDGSLRPENYPRGLIISSGEDIPKGQSIRARLVIIELSNGGIDLDILTQSQEDAATGLFAQSLSGYIKWLAPQIDSLKDRLPQRKLELRKLARKDTFSHDRTPDITASLTIGWNVFLEYALDVGAISESARQELEDRGWEAICGAAKAQRSHQANEEPAARFLELLSAAIAGGFGYVAHVDGNRQPEEFPSNWGWRSITTGSAEHKHTEWRPQGDKVGWVECDDLYLETNAAYAVVQKLARAQGSSLSVSQQTLWKRLAEKGHLASKEKKDRLKVRRNIEGKRRNVIHLKTNTLSIGRTDPTDPTDPDTDTDIW